MKISQLAKTAILILSLTGLAACSSTGEEAQEPVVAETESGVDATTRRTQELEAEARARAAAAEERMARMHSARQSFTSTSTWLNSARPTATY